ncbi:kelch-like protein 33 [Erpetoichthys calabaricus]|uniref:kelch-like protein 33 n=1 Tax=Erpetoichthys calabaricus TaxID=27687 RepID=UPI002234DC7A|nr:kelch-like protein 33 [Erpetoichthys calabaricus]XP_051779123.1 kelch-like protein 33 [Erpetoichthys calabaricus]
MFSSGMKESQQSIVKLTSLSSSTLSTILNFIYSGTISLSWDNIFEVMEAVLQYQVVSALPLCTKFIQKEINDEYCLDCLLLAEAFNLTDLMKYVEQYILNNFRKVSLLPKFQDLSAEKLANLLENDGLCVSTEMEVFWSVLHWIEEDKKARTELAPKVMKSVRFPLLSPKELKEVWATEIMRDNLACKSILESSLSCSKYNLGNKGVMCKARTPGQVLVFIGGDHLNNDYSKRLPSKMLWFANRFLTDADNRNSTEWHPLSSIPDLPRFRHAVAVFNNQLYVFGGSRYYGQRDILKSVKRYDPDEDSWEDLPDMNECRNYFPVVCVNGVMYALGGNMDDFHCLSSVECYTLGDSAWRFVEPLDIPLCGHAAVTWDKEIYISGGCDNKYNCTKNVFQYNALKGCTPQASMWSERGGHVMQVIGDRFYVAGGLRQSFIGYTDQYLCECYNPLEDTWTAIASLPRPHVSPASAVLDSKLYILGGFCAETYKDCHLMHCYDLLTNRWMCMGALPEAFADVAACVLVVPARLKQ